MELKYLFQNKQALEKAKRFFPNLRDAFEDKPGPTMLCLKNICRFGCANCGSNEIDEGILKFFDFQPNALCIKCQNQNSPVATG